MTSLKTLEIKSNEVIFRLDRVSFMGFSGGGHAIQRYKLMKIVKKLGPFIKKIQLFVTIKPGNCSLATTTRRISLIIKLES